MALGASLQYARVPLFDGVEDYLAAGLCPGGTRRNLDFCAPLTRFPDTWDEARRLLLADAQTSGGLLIAIDERRASALLDALAAHGVATRAVIGRIEPADQPGRITVA
jgi:selenide,water dikinase